MNLLGSKLLPNVYNAWVRFVLSFSVIHTLGANTSWLLYPYWKHFLSFYWNYRCLISPYSFPATFIRSFQPLFTLLIEAPKEIFAGLLSPGFVFLLCLMIFTITIILTLNVFTNFIYIWETYQSTYNLEWRSSV